MLSKDRILEYLEDCERSARKKKHNYRPFDDVMYHYYDGLEEAYHNAVVFIRYDFS